MQLNEERSHALTDRTVASVRMTVREAADALGVTVEAVRGRMHRGKYLKEKDDEGRVFVLLPSDQLPNGRAGVHERSSERLGSGSGERSRADGPNVYRHVGPADEELVKELRGEVAYLKDVVATRDDELRRKDTIIMTLAQRVPELEAAPQNVQEDARRSTEQAAGPEEMKRRPWWRKIFDG